MKKSKKKIAQKKSSYKYPTSLEFREDTAIGKIFGVLKNQKKTPTALLEKKYGKLANIGNRLAQLSARLKRTNAGELLRGDNFVQLKLKKGQKQAA